MPRFDLRVHWGSDLYVCSSLLPLVAFDIATTGRIQRTTLVGLALVFAGHVTVNALWGSPTWHELAHGACTALL